MSNPTKLSDYVSLYKSSVNPANHPDKTFYVYTLPGFDNEKLVESYSGDRVKSAKDKIDSNTILFNKLNVRFKRIWNLEDIPNNSVCSSEFLRLKADNCDQNYLFYFLHQDYVTSYLSTASGGTSHSHSRISSDDLLSVPFDPPPIETQRKIGGLLSSLDERIENNNKICKNLESLILAQYNYWFVQYDFPDKNLKPYKSSNGQMVESIQTGPIPQGWGSSAVGDLIDLQPGVSYTSAEIAEHKGVPMINLGSIDKNRAYRDEKIKYFNGAVPKNKYVYPGGMLLACTDLTSDGLIIGCPIFVPRNHDVFTYSMDLSRIEITSKRILPTYLYMTLRTDWYHSYIKRFASGTNVRHLDVAGVTRYPIVIPPLDLQLRFEGTTAPMFAKINDILIENMELFKIRDWLLPVLMNGQAKING